MKGLFLFPILFCLSFALGQSPTYFVLGEHDLATVDIYGLHFDEIQQKLYAVTDHGAFVLHGNRFKRIKSEENQKGSSVFDVQTGPDGVYCQNLRGQLFKITDDLRLELVYELPSDQIGVSFWYHFSGEEMWIITTSKIYSFPIIKGRIAFDQLKEHWNDKFNSGKKIVAFSRLGSGEAIFSFKSTGETFLLKEGLIRALDVKNIHRNGRHFFDLGGMIYDVDVSGNIYSLDDGKLTGTYEYNEFFQPLNDTLIIGRCQRSGVHFIHHGNIEDSPKMFEETFISSITTNDQGTVFMGTFKNGVIVIPNLNVKEYSFKNNLLTGLTVDGTKTLVSSRQGKIFRIDEGVVDEIYQNRENIDQIFTSRLLIGEIPKAPEVIHLPSRNITNPKDVWVIDEHSMLVAQFDRLVFIHDDLCKAIPAHISSSDISKTLVIGKRFTSVGYCSIEDLIYYADNNGFHSRNFRTGETKAIQYQGKKIVVDDIYCDRSGIWVAAQNKGLLHYKNGILVDYYSEGSELKKLHIKKIKKANGVFYLLSSRGLIEFDPQKKEFNPLGIKEGIHNPSIADFDITDTSLHLLYKSSVLIMPFDRKRRKKYSNPKLIIDSILVNRRRVNESEKNNLDYNDNSISIYYDVRSIEIRNEINLFYRLLPLDTQWVKVDLADDRPITFSSLRDGNFTFQLKAVYEGQSSYSKEVQFFIDKPFWRKWWFILGTTLVMLLLISIYYIRRLRIQKMRLEAINEINTSKITAIQSQMNPHFIFNALNSIQALVLKGDTDNSYGFINKFSHLMRRTLTNSEKDAIPIDEEIDLINTYLELEKLRFREDFSYEINNQIDEDVCIPPMLIQPFVENAILHGLLSKEGKKTLKIDFSMKDKAVVCIITDNGIGRDKAREIKKRRKGDHESFATKGIENRLKLLRNKHGAKLGYHFKDLKNKNGEALGTQLKVTIPIV